jgi:hypothetical protein
MNTPPPQPRALQPGNPHHQTFLAGIHRQSLRDAFASPVERKLLVELHEADIICTPAIKRVPFSPLSPN